jgi:sirohydrochlorin cobaltochelatase
MLTPGGNHAEEDIPSSLAAARERHPQMEIVYAWPYDIDHIAGLFFEHVDRFVAEE